VNSAAEPQSQVSFRLPSIVTAVALMLLGVVLGWLGLRLFSQPESVSLTVYAPWSMEMRMRRIFEEFQAAHPEVTFRLETGTPGKLVKRMEAGERPDVYVSMGPMGVPRNARMFPNGWETALSRSR